MFRRWFFIATALVYTSSALLLAEESWDGLTVTFGVFAGLPRTEREARTEGWTKVSDCDESSKFRGVRYVKENDYAVTLLFDVNGYIAGIQTGIAKSGLSSAYPPVKQRGKIFQDDGQHYVVTAYFIDPARICKDGRTASEFSLEGTGNSLYIQNGSDPVSQSILVPPTETEVKRATEWTLGHCFPLMGVHYWYDLSVNMSCDDFQPVFLLYNRGSLNAFGLAFGMGQNSTRFEHPEHSHLATFLNPVPACLTTDYPELSSIHIYMTQFPIANLC